MLRFINFERIDHQECFGYYLLTMILYVRKESTFLNVKSGPIITNEIFSWNLK